MREDEPVRYYLPIAVEELLALLADPEATHTAPASAVTPALRAALPEEDEEGLELSAFLTAADLAVLRIARLGARPVRVVLSVDLPAGAASATDPADGLALPSSAGSVSVRRADLVAVHVDDPQADEPLLAAAVAGDQEAFDELAEVDLLWFDPSEFAELTALLRP